MLALTSFATLFRLRWAPAIALKAGRFWLFEQVPDGPRSLAGVELSRSPHWAAPRL